VNVIILGGGIAGLLAAYVFRRFKPLVLEGSPKLGGNYTAGGLKYIRQTSAMERLLADLGMTWKEYKPIGLLYVGGMWEEHPGWLKSLNSNQRETIQCAHWRRTRFTDDGFRADCMNDPTGNGGHPALRCDHGELIYKLGEHAMGANRALVRLNVRIEQITAGTVRVDGVHVPYDLLIPTIPLAALSRLAPWARLPSLHAWQLNIADFIAEERAPSWDYMYTPLEQKITRITWAGSGLFQIEVPGETALDSDADRAHVVEEAQRALSPFASMLRLHATRKIPGHLEPPRVPIQWPDNWCPLGRFTQWEPRATAERVLHDALVAHGKLANDDHSQIEAR
jgi:hypothetical protein